MNNIDRRSALKNIAGFSGAAAFGGLVVASPGIAGATSIEGTPAAEDAPFRILDTRSGAKPQAGSVLRVTPHGPITNKSALFLNVTVTDAEGSGFVTVFPLGAAKPNTSNVNWWIPGSILSNMALVRCSSLGEFNLAVSVNATHVVIDVMGSISAL